MCHSHPGIRCLELSVVNCECFAPGSTSLARLVSLLVKRLISSYFLFSRPVSIPAQLLTLPKCILAALCAIGWQIPYACQRSNTR
ncbi:hypothetical protein M405DRAFT_813640, partial [Rhizopogon salebrosus TDB-379]